MGKRLFARYARPVARLALGMALLFVVIAAVSAVAPRRAACDTPCQCWYCAQYTWVYDPNTGQNFSRCDSPCDHGCAGACAYNDSSLFHNFRL